MFRELRVSSMEKQLNEVTSVRVRNRVYFAASSRDFYSFLFVTESRGGRKREREWEGGEGELMFINIYLLCDQLHRFHYIYIGNFSIGRYSKARPCN